MRKRLTIRIYGRVTGVGFRWAAYKTALKMGITGLVRNEDGHIYLEAEGEESGLAKFLEWCRKGPFWAKVEKVEAESGELKGYKDFTVTR